MQGLERAINILSEEKTVGDKKESSSYRPIKRHCPVQHHRIWGQQDRFTHRDTDRKIKVLRYCEVLQRGDG